MKKIDTERVDVPSPGDRIREARIRIMDIEKRVNVVLLEINEKECMLKYDISLNDESKVECQKDIRRRQVHLEALLRDL